MAQTFLKLQPVPGAAEYVHGRTESGGWGVFMLDKEAGVQSCIDTARTEEIARNKANRWQIKENQAVTKANKKK